MPNQKKVPVTERALIQRINRVLAKDDKVLKASRNSDPSTGRYFIIDVNINGITATNCDLEALGRELEVLKPFEELA